MNDDYRNKIFASLKNKAEESKDYQDNIFSSLAKGLKRENGDFQSRIFERLSKFSAEDREFSGNKIRKIAYFVSYEDENQFAELIKSFQNKGKETTIFFDEISNKLAFGRSNIEIEYNYKADLDSILNKILNFDLIVFWNYDNDLLKIMAHSYKLGKDVICKKITGFEQILSPEIFKKVRFFENFRDIIKFIENLD